jgi:hypothetical protein
LSELRWIGSGLETDGHRLVARSHASRRDEGENGCNCCSRKDLATYWIWRRTG